MPESGTRIKKFSSSPEPLGSLLFCNQRRPRDKESVSYFRRGESSCSAKEPIVGNKGCYLVVWFSLLNWVKLIPDLLNSRVAAASSSQIYLNPPLFTTMSQTRKMMSAIKSAVLCNFSVFFVSPIAHWRANYKWFSYNSKRKHQTSRNRLFSVWIQCDLNDLSHRNTVRWTSGKENCKNN